MQMKRQGVIAAGNKDTAAAAAEMLQDGGNAFDAMIAALLASFVAEPVLSSPGGGGFLLAQQTGSAPEIFDFFAQTPLEKKPQQTLDFHAADAQFSAATQEFHIGLGSVATPGMVAGLFEIHQALASLPMARLAEPAIALARHGHAIDPLQAHILEVVKPIMLATPGAQEIYESRSTPGSPLQPGEKMLASDLANFIDALVEEGARLFYEGDVAMRIYASMEEGGSITLEDLKAYQVKRRASLTSKIGSARLFTNPVPSSGGTLITLSLNLLDRLRQADHTPQDSSWLALLVDVMHATNEARQSSGFADEQSKAIADHILSAPFVSDWEKSIKGRALQTHGTTHISIADAHGNFAGATVSNGEGCGHVVPGTGIMLNNMLGEEDINMKGFFAWDCNKRISSMMAPCLIKWPNGRTAILGSGGSNRIRTALTQVISQLVFFDLGAKTAINAPRLHFERGLLNMEHGFDDETLAPLKASHADHKVWPVSDIFFGGVHLAESGPEGARGAADPRRGGFVLLV